MGVVLSPVVLIDVVILFMDWEYGGCGESNSIVFTGGVMVAAGLAV